MEPIVQHTRLITRLLVAIFFAPIVGSGFPSPATLTQIDQRHSREIEAEIAHWSAQLKSSDQEQRREAVIKLSHLEGNAPVPALVSALTDASPAIRALVLAGLGEHSDNSVIPLICSRLTSDKDAFVRKTAAYALARFSGTERTAALIAALKDKDLEVRGAASVSLGNHADGAAVESLEVALSDKSSFVRAQSARALGINGSAATQTVAALTRLLASDPDVEVKRQAATALGTIGDRSTLPALERASHESDPYLAQAAREAIKLIEGRK